MTSWWRRLVNGGLQHEHEPIPVDEHDDGEGFRPARYAQSENDNIPSWIRWLFQGPNETPHGDYRPAVQHETDLQVRDDEQAQLEQAIRQSLQEVALREEMERDDHALRRAMEISKKEAEEQEAHRLEANEPELAIVPAPPPLSAPVLLPDLMSVDPLPVDLLGPDPADRNHKDLMLLQDEALARSLQQEINLLDDDHVGSGQHDMLATLTGGERSGSVALPPGSLGLPAGWNTPTGPSGPVPPPYLALPAPPAMSGGAVCGGCKKMIVIGRYLTCLGHSWHPDCFRCKACNKTIVEKEFKAMGSDPYHSECHRQLFHPKCSVCNNYVPTKPGGVIEYRSMPFWGDQYCPEHDTDGTPRCTSCQRYERRDTPYVDLDDGRKLCLNCVETVVVDTKDCTPLFQSILVFYEGLGMPIRQEIPLLCVETQALNAARAGEQKDHNHSPLTRGLCLSEEQTIQTVVRLPGFPGGGLLGIGQQTQQLHRDCEVTAILVLYGLPQVLTGSILAHELMHAYLKLDGRFPPLTPDLEEGICQVLAHLWLQSQVSPSGRQRPSLATDPTQEYKDKFVEFCMHQIATDTSLIYGEGFRRAHASVLEYGLKQTLDHMQLTGTLPG